MVAYRGKKKKKYVLIMKKIKCTKTEGHANIKLGSKVSNSQNTLIGT
jgi:hypothetical protein